MNIFFRCGEGGETQKKKKRGEDQNSALFLGEEKKLSAAARSGRVSTLVYLSEQKKRKNRR